MNRRIRFCFHVFLWLYSTVILGQINHQVAFSSDIKISDKVLDDGETYTGIQIPGTLHTDSVGFPSLPVKYIKLIVPANATGLNVMVNTTKELKYKLEHKVEPLQEPVPIGFYDKPGFVKPDKKKYDSNAPYPSQLVEIVETGYFKGSHLVTLVVFPCQYYPKQDELDFFETIDFTLNYEENGIKTENHFKAQENSKYRKILESIIENPGDIEKFSTAGESSESNSVSVQTASLKSMRKNGISIDCDYVIVTSEGLAPAFNEFMAWKRRKGIDIELVTIESIKENYTGDSISGINDDAGKLRQFLSEFYNPMKDCQYALLGGDYTIVPIRYGWSINNYDSIDHIIPTDLYFADFDGDWETDNDGRYGEPEDNVDFNPEIYVGRLLVTNADEVINWTKKLMTYEINPGNGDYSYLTKAFFTQGDQMQAGNQASYILNKATWITDHVIYEESGGPYTQTTPSFPKGQDVVNEFNNHFGLCSFMEHGGPNNVTIAAPEYNECLDIGKYKLASMDSYSTSCEIAENGNGLDNMTNVNYPSINYSISCDNMPFDDYKTEAGERNFGESYTVISGGGGPVFIGNTRYGWVSTSYVLYGYFIDLISGGISNIGIAEATSKQSTSDGYLRFSHNLLGCPETEIWTATPTIFSSASVTQNGSSITVSTGGITADKICVMSALNTGYFQVQPNVTACTFTNVPQPYYVTITKTNYIPYLKNPTAVYIQNQTISSTAYLNCQTVSAGYNVDSSQTQGNVVIQNGAKITFNATGDILLDKGFEVQLGAFFEAK